MTNVEFLSKYVFKELTEEVLAECEHFSCGVADLNEYFQKDVLAYSQRMVSRSYVFCPMLSTRYNQRLLSYVASDKDYSHLPLSELAAHYSGCISSPLMPSAAMRE